MGTGGAEDEEFDTGTVNVVDTGTVVDTGLRLCDAGKMDDGKWGTGCGEWETDSGAEWPSSGDTIEAAAVPAPLEGEV